jgi:hypothetical protein
VLRAEAVDIVSYQGKAQVSGLPAADHRRVDLADRVLKLRR